MQRPRLFLFSAPRPPTGAPPFGGAPPPRRPGAPADPEDGSMHMPARAPRRVRGRLDLLFFGGVRCVAMPQHSVRGRRRFGASRGSERQPGRTRERRPQMLSIPMSGLSLCRACPRVGPVEAISGIPSHRRPGRVVPPDHAHRPISWHRRRTGVAGGHTVLRTGRRRLSAAITACATPAAGDAVGSLAEGPGGPAGVTHCPPIKWRLAGRAATGPGSGARRTPPEAQRGRNSAGLQFGTKIRRCPAMSETSLSVGGPPRATRNLTTQLMALKPDQ